MSFGSTALSLGLFGLALLCIPAPPRHRYWQHSSLLAGLVLITLVALEWISDQFSGGGFNKSVIYHLRYGFEGAGIREFLGMLTADALALIASVTALFALLRRSKLTARRVSPWLSSACMAGALTFNPTLPKVVDASRDLWPGKRVPGQALTKIDGYVRPQLPAMAVRKPPNLVWIYAESLERTYFDETLFPGLTPDLQSLERTALSLTNLTQVSGAAWTIAGMVASQCGVPLITGGAHGNSLGAYENFLPGAECMGDLLAKRGYTLHYSAGAALSFAGKGNYYRGHGFHSVRGREEFARDLPIGTPINSWGLHDSTLFTAVREEFSHLIARGQPFGLFTLTLDTHHPKGLPSPECAAYPYRDGSNPILNAVHCSQRLLVELVQDLQRRDPDNNTLIVLTSDHLAMPNTAIAELVKGQRRNLALFIWPDHIKPQTVTAVHSTLDTGVTALRLLGFPIEAFAFGRAAEGAEVSLAARFDLEAHLEQATPNLLTLWDLPDHLESLIVRPKLGTAELNGTPRRLPLIIALRTDGNIQKLFTPDERSKLRTRKDMLALTQDSEQLKWIERCERINTILQVTSQQTQEWCVWDWKSDSITPIAENIVIGSAVTVH